MNYENRITVFIDILGFKQKIKLTEDKNGNDQTQKINDLFKTFQLIRSILDIDTSENYISRSKQITQFSDSIVISFLDKEESEVFHTLFDIQILIMNLVYQNVICRGGIAYGKLIHTDKIIFGPALVEAYEIESKAALYPRVILDKSIIEIGKKHHSFHHKENDEQEAILDLITIDSDEMYYIDYFGKAQSQLDDPDLDMPTYIEDLRGIIIEGLADAYSPDIKVKYTWMQNKFNQMVKEYTDPKFTKAQAMEFLEVYYKNLKPIANN